MSEAEMARLEGVLFQAHSGVTGIKFDQVSASFFQPTTPRLRTDRGGVCVLQYDAIPVEVSGPGSEDLVILDSFEQLQECVALSLIRSQAQCS